MDKLYFWVCMAIIFKSITVGSDFNFAAWIKNGKKYWDWHTNRETWGEYKAKNVL